jgi:uncharacterized membrane protein YfcA
MDFPSTAFIFIYLIGGILAGFIDSIAGGGGLITLPLLALTLGPGIDAIATNKINGTVGALMALIVYARRGHLDWRSGALFTTMIVCGSFLGSLGAPFFSPDIFRFLILAICPVLLVVIWQKDRWLQTQPENAEVKAWLVAFVGLGCGLYDGAFGPGGGTFMLLSLTLVAKLPLLVALAASKLANTASASVGLVSYGLRGYIHWWYGASMATGLPGPIDGPIPVGPRRRFGRKCGCPAGQNRRIQKRSGLWWGWAIDPPCGRPVDRWPRFPRVSPRAPVSLR